MLCLAVTCHLHFWQNDRDLLRATVVTRRGNGYRNKSQHINVTPGEEKKKERKNEKKTKKTLLLQGLEPGTF